jgi:hypothetical protein
MKKIISLVLWLSFWLVPPDQPASAARLSDLTAQSSPQSASGDGVLCLPGVYMSGMGDCLPLGPSAYLTEMASKGFFFPQTPLAAKKPDFSFTYVDQRYGEVRTPNAPVYGSIEDALKGNKRQANRRIDSSFSYISYTEEAVVDGKRFYMVEPGEWMTANDVSRLGSVPLFQGLTFKQTPRNAFGWILTYLSPGPVETKRTPGYDLADYTGHILNNHEIVQVYAETQIGDEAWYMIGLDEWVHQNVVARVVPNTTPPKGVTGDRWIEVNLFEQTISIYDQRQLVFATLIASGLDPFWTRPGLFQVYQKLDTTPMRGAFEADRSDAYYLEDVPWTMYFDQARALHGAYWRANLGFPQSHGCVNLSVGDANWIYQWANIGDWVYVWDPSGKTPIDPSVYTAGGA